MTAQELATYAAIVLSVFFTYIPGLNTWYASLEPAAKRLLMLFMLVVTTMTVFGLSCWTVSSSQVPGVTCDFPGAVGLFKALVAAVIANQAAYLISPKPKKVLLALRSG